MQLFYIIYILFKLLGTGIAMIGIKSVLDVWWLLSGIFAGGMLGLFLLGIISHSTRNAEALAATLTGLLVIIWLTFSSQFPNAYAALRSPFHPSMIIVIGTLTIFLVGLLLTRIRGRKVETSLVKPSEKIGT